MELGLCRRSISVSVEVIRLFIVNTGTASIILARFDDVAITAFPTLCACFILTQLYYSKRYIDTKPA